MGDPLFDDRLPDHELSFMAGVKLPDHVASGNRKLRSAMNLRLDTGVIDPDAGITVTITQGELVAMSGIVGAWLHRYGDMPTRTMMARDHGAQERTD